MSEHDAKVEVDETGDEDAVKVEKKDQEEEENEKKDTDEKENKETDEDKKEEESEEINEVKDEPKAEEKQEEEEMPAKKVPTTPKKDAEVPLYDQPLEMSGKRDRKKVERFVQETKKEEVSVIGRGVALGDIPYIGAMIMKMPVDELKVLHRVAYNRPGSSNEVKKNLRKFNGFPYTKEDKKYQTKLSTVERIVMSEIKKMLMILGLERSGIKAEVVERLMNFMMHPEDMGRKPPGSRKKGKNRGRRSKKSLEKKQNSTSQDDSCGSSESEQSGSEQEEEEEMEEEEVEEKPKKTPGRKSVGKKTPGKRAAAAKKTPVSKRPKPAPDSDDSDSDDEPLAKKVKQPPSDAELKIMVKKILEGANLEEVTMKSVCRQVYDNYPDFDLTHKKLFIKETVKSIIS